MLLPGMGCNADLWSPLTFASGLEVRGLVLTEPDLDTQVDRLLDELPTRFALGGLSLGAIVAMAVIRRAPERVSRLALLSTNPYAPTPEQRQGWQRLRTRLERESAREVQASLVPTLLSPAVVSSRPDLVELTLAMADEVGEVGFDRQLQLQATRVDERPGLRDVRCPTVVIAALDDLLCGLDKHQEIAELVSGARLATIGKCAHLSTLEQPGLVSAALGRWGPAESGPG